MILAFFLSMPGCPSWNGKWSGDGKKYCVTRKFTGAKSLENAAKILQEGYYTYGWSDGWCAGIEVKVVDSRQATKLRKESQGFAGYDWMVDTIIQYGRPLDSVQVKRLLEQGTLSTTY
jgi:hypothetical protein